MNENTFDSMILFRNWYEVLKDMDGDKFKKAFCMLAEYALNRVEPEVIDDKELKMFFKMAKPAVDSNIQKKLSGSIGGKADRKPSKTSKSKTSKSSKKADEAEPEEIKTADVDEDGFTSDQEKVRADYYAKQKLKEQEKREK